MAYIRQKGDISQSATNPSDITVTSIQGNPIQATTYGAGQDQYVLTWVNGSTQLQAKSNAAVATLTSMTGLFGDGSDGAVTFDGSTTVAGMVPSSNVYTQTRPVNFTNVTVNNGITWNWTSWQVFISGTLTNNGTIGNPGSAGGSSASGGTAGPAVVGHQFTVSGQGGAGAAPTGNGTNGNGPAVGNQLYPNGTGNGGAGGNSGGNTGGSAGTLNAPNVNVGSGRTADCGLRCGITISNQTSGQQTSGGAGGGGGASSSSGTGGGGGGGGGGNGCLAVFTLNNLGTITCAGGNGGNGTGTGNAGGGGGGGGGTLWLIYRNLTALGTVTVAGGSGGSGHGTGSGGSPGVSGNLLTFVI